MKLSTAILRGSRGERQAIGELFNGRGYCALGAAYKGLGVKLEPYCSLHNEKLRALIPCLYKMYRPESMDLLNQVTILNDVKLWSFKRIAAWLKRKGY